MRYGRTAKEKRELVAAGFLPVYSVDTEEQAEQLLVVACPRNIEGEFVAPELAEEQTLDRLASFGERLAELDAMIESKRNG